MMYGRSMDSTANSVSVFRQRPGSHISLKRNSMCPVSDFHSYYRPMHKSILYTLRYIVLRNDKMLVIPDTSEAFTRGSSTAARYSTSRVRSSSSRYTTSRRISGTSSRRRYVSTTRRWAFRYRSCFDLQEWLSRLYFGLLRLPITDSIVKALARKLG